MKPEKNQMDPSPALLQDLQAEVAAESAPLLQFILRNSAYITGVVVLLLVALGASALWNWHDTRQNEEARAELAQIVQSKQGEERTKALLALADKVPSASRLAVLMACGQSATEHKDYATAAEAFARVAKDDSEGALGQSASLSQAASLLNAGKAAEALTLLQGLEGRIGADQRPVQLRLMLAEAALAAGNKDLAAATYQALSQEGQGMDGGYYRSRAEALGAAAAPASGEAKSGK